jgi:hypothetical protein
LPIFDWAEATLALAHLIAHCTGERLEINPLEIFGAKLCRAEIELYLIDRVSEIFGSTLAYSDWGMTGRPLSVPMSMLPFNYQPRCPAFEEAGSNHGFGIDL